MAIVQAPQDYRDGDENAFKNMCYSEYSGFFFIGMVTRNERNAIIQHGTMTLVRKSVLEGVGGWAEWCITEDAELGLRILEKGYEAFYTPESYGKGVMPDTFIDFKKQRFRWAYGAVQILKKHFRTLMGSEDTSLKRGQKYHFLAGWLPWIADSANLVFNIAAIAWSVAMLTIPKRLDPPMVEFCMLPLILFTFKLGKLFYLYRTKVKAGFGQIVGAALAGIALSHTIGWAVLQALFTSDKPFFRTPKMANSHAVIRALASVKIELLFMILMQAAGFALLYYPKAKTLDVHIWVIVLFIQSIPYAMSVIVSIISAFPKIPAKVFGRQKPVRSAEYMNT